MNRTHHDLYNGVQPCIGASRAGRWSNQQQFATKQWSGWTIKLSDYTNNELNVIYSAAASADVFQMPCQRQCVNVGCHNITTMYDIPEKIKEYIKGHFENCNKQLSYDLAIFPGIREESIDNNFISYFSRIPGPIKFDNNWTLRIDAHFIGGGRHYENWEVADIGLMIIFRRNGKILRSKMVFLQSKKLYPASIKHISTDPYMRMGMGRLLVTDDEHLDLIKSRLVKFEEKSKYKAFKKDSLQQRAMSSFQDRFDINMY